MRRGSFVRRTAALGSAFCLFREDRVVNSLRHTAVPEQAIEGPLIQKVERSHHNISRQMLAILAHADAFHPGGTRSIDTVLGIFYNDATLGRDAQFGAGDQEHFRVRLTSVYIFSGHNGFKAFARV
jgi:hypothetical protein